MLMFLNSGVSKSIHTYPFITLVLINFLQLLTRPVFRTTVNKRLPWRSALGPSRLMHIFLLYNSHVNFINQNYCLFTSGHSTLETELLLDKRSSYIYLAHGHSAFTLKTVFTLCTQADETSTLQWGEHNTTIVQVERLPCARSFHGKMYKEVPCIRYRSCACTVEVSCV